MKKQAKKGFTIVELVIVIALIAILAAVLIPTFSNVINNAHESSDMTMVKNLNTILNAEEKLGHKAETMQDALDQAEAGGYVVSRITPTSTGDILWDQESNRFLLVNTKKNVVVYKDESATEDPDFTNNAHQYWKITKDAAAESAGYSLYLTNEGYKGDLTDLQVKAGLDVGEHTDVVKVTYTGSDKAKSVAIFTNGGSLTINAALDVVEHYGDVDKVVVEAIADESYHENGSVMVSLEVKDGHIVIESSATVKEVVVPENAAADTKVDVKENSTVETVVVDNASVAVEVKENANVKNVVAADNANVVVPATANVNKVQKTTVSNAAELKNAIADNSVKYILLAGDIDVEDAITIERDLIIDGSESKHHIVASKQNVQNGRTINVGKQGEAISVTLKNVTVDGPTSGGYTRGVNVWYAGVNIKLFNTDITCSDYAINVTSLASNTQMSIYGSNISGWAALNVWAFGSDIKIDNSVLTGTNDKSYNKDGWNDFATICFEADTTAQTNEYGYNNKITINNSTVKATSTSQNKQALVAFNGGEIGATACVLELNGCDLSEISSLYTAGGQGNKIYINQEIKFEN